MKQLILATLLSLVSFGSDVSQSTGTVHHIQPKQSSNKIPSELMNQITHDHRELLTTFNGSVTDLFYNCIVQRLDLNKDEVPDFLIAMRSYPFAGNHVGTLLIYQKTSSGYRNLSPEDDLAYSLDRPTKIIGGKAFSNGFVDLEETIGTRRTKLIFNGRYYKA